MISMLMCVNASAKSLHYTVSAMAIVVYISNYATRDIH